MPEGSLCYHWWWVWTRPLTAEDQAELSAIIEEWGRAIAAECAREAPPRAFETSDVEYSEGGRRMEFFTTSTGFSTRWMAALKFALGRFYHAAVVEHDVEEFDDLDGWYPPEPGGVGDRWPGVGGAFGEAGKA
ncbi:MAG: hypothetical protein HY719_07660 [Planctomycetes bacterium]|nr:hypothetical protein [Planctomycetota bacterium]